MKILTLGLGYVGCVNAVCAAARGHEVHGVDLSKEKLNCLSEGRLPIKEPGLQELFEQVQTKDEGGSFTWGQSLEDLPWDFDLILICVGTPALPSGDVDLSQVTSTFEGLGAALKRVTSPQNIAIRSTLPPGTTEGVLCPILEKASGKERQKDFTLGFYPEFLREGNAVDDFYNPSLFVLGTGDSILIELVGSAFDYEKKLKVTSVKSAEMLKYANNSFHALKVSFANEMGALCRATGVSGDEVMDLFVEDTCLNISPKYLSPGAPFGGPCLTKELKAIDKMFSKSGLRAPLLSSVLMSNERQKERILDLIFSQPISSWGFAGMTFKPGTDDTRSSPIIDIMMSLRKTPTYKEDKSISIFDSKEALSRLKNELSDDINLCSRFSEILQSCDGVILGSSPLEDIDYELLLEYPGKIIDMQFHKVPTELSKKPNYYSVC